MLLDKERLDDLEYNGLRLIQNPDGYCFTSDSVLLVNSARIRRGDSVCDLCTGSGVIALLAAEKYAPKRTVGVELQPRLADMARRSVEYNGLSDRVSILLSPVQGVEKTLGCGTFDVVLANPPYAPAEEKAEYTEEEICKTEAKLSLRELIATASALVKFGGTFYMINKAYRLTDAICLMREYRLEPKKLRLVQPKESKDIDTFIIEGKKCGKPHLTVPAPLIVYNEDGSYTDEARRMYGK